MSPVKKLWRNFLWQAMSVLPKNQNKAVCQSYYGRGYSDSPRAVADEMRSRGWKVYWVVKNAAEAQNLPDNVTPIMLDSTKAIYHLCTAGVWVDNCRKWAYTQKRGKTCYVQAWHGFPLKRIEGDAAAALDASYVTAAKKDSKIADLFLSDSTFLTKIYRRAFWYSGEVLECGFPRNDILVNGDPNIVKRVRNSLNIPNGVRLLLYAPTFRKDMGLSVYDVDYARCVTALEHRFGGKWLILAKLHPNVASKASQLSLDPNFVLNVSDYPDIQDLYLASDAMLSDYSSVMFDYMNTGKPCFLYVNDLSAYKDDRNFYFDLDKLPYSRAESNTELEKIILNFDQTAQSKAIARFCNEFGIKENGTAAKQTVDYLEKRREKLKGKRI